MRAVGAGEVPGFFLTGDPLEEGGGDLEKGEAPGIRRSGGGGSYKARSIHYPQDRNESVTWKEQELQ